MALVLRLTEGGVRLKLAGPCLCEAPDAAQRTLGLSAPCCLLGSALLPLLAPLWTSWSNLFMTSSSAGPFSACCPAVGTRPGPKFRGIPTSLLQKRRLGEGRRMAVRCQAARAGASSLWGRRTQVLAVELLCTQRWCRCFARLLSHSGCCSRPCSAGEDEHPGVSAKGSERGGWHLDSSADAWACVGCVSAPDEVQGCLERSECGVPGASAASELGSGCMGLGPPHLVWVLGDE